jgi:hypothetical protein
MRNLMKPGIVLLLAAVLWLGACSDDDNPTNPGGGTDTTPPEVVGIDPVNGEAGVSLDDSVFVIFSEAMDTATAAGQVTLSSGANAGQTWYDNRTLVVGHDDWAEGTKIDVTVGTGLTDAAGNALAAAYGFSFWTLSTTELLLLDTTPASGATGINRDDPILLQFSSDVNLGTIPGNVTITDNNLKATYPFTVEDIEDGLVLLDPVDTLPAATLLTVTVGTGVQSFGGLSLVAPATFTFTTGTSVDNTPPTVVSTDPTNGNMAVAADQGFFRMTFSEPINPDSFEPSRWNLAFFFLVEGLDIRPVMSEGGTVMTVPLPSPLPAGLPINITFAGIQDLAGNVQPVPFVLNVKVAGMADYVPVVNGARNIVEVDFTQGVIGNPTPTNQGFYEYFRQLEVQPGDSFRLVSYDDPSFTVPTDWEVYRKTSSALQWLGFEEIDQALRNKEMFDSPLDILPLPIAAGPWNSSTTVTIVGEGQFRANMAGEVLGQGDYEIAESEGVVFIKDAWTVVRNLDVDFLDGVEWVTAFTQRDTFWFAPTLGDVRAHTYEEDVGNNQWDDETIWFYPYLGQTKDGSSLWSR